MGLQTGDGLPDRGWSPSHGVVFQTEEGVPDRGWDTRHGWGSRQGMIRCQTGMMGCQAGVE